MTENFRMVRVISPCGPINITLDLNKKCTLHNVIEYLKYQLKTIYGFEFPRCRFGNEENCVLMYGDRVLNDFNWTRFFFRNQCRLLPLDQINNIFTITGPTHNMILYLNKNQSFESLRNKISTLTSIPSNKIIFADVEDIQSPIRSLRGIDRYKEILFHIDYPFLHSEQQTQVY